MNVKSVQAKAKTCLVKHGLMLKGIVLHGLTLLILFQDIHI